MMDFNSTGRLRYWEEISWRYRETHWPASISGYHRNGCCHSWTCSTRNCCGSLLSTRMRQPFKSSRNRERLLQRNPGCGSMHRRYARTIRSATSSISQDGAAITQKSFCKVTTAFWKRMDTAVITRCRQLAVRACCWAHMRRYWREAIPNIKGITSKESEAIRGFHYCEKLFALEREYKKLSDEGRQKARNERSRPVVDEYFEWVRTLTVAGGKLGQAVTYARNQEQYLRTFLDHGNLELSNNPAENTIRPFVLGRKNWLFADSQDGARALAICYTILETAKANHLDIRKYLDWLLSTLPRISENSRQDELESMLPWDSEEQRFFRTRDY